MIKGVGNQPSGGLMGQRNKDFVTIFVSLLRGTKIPPKSRETWHLYPRVETLGYQEVAPLELFMNGEKIIIYLALRLTILNVR